MSTKKGVRYIVIGERLENCEFPIDLDRLSLTITQSEDVDFSGEGDQVGFDVASDPKLPLEYVQALGRLFGDRDYGRFINKVTTLKGKDKPNPVIMNIAFRKGKVDPAAITYTISRK